VRLKPDLEELLDATARRERKSRSAIIHEALAARLRPVKPRLGDVIRAVLATAPAGLRLERKQPSKTDRRAWKR
jgi:predicted transcriptional regulator